MKEYNGKKVFTIKKDGNLIDVYEDNPNFDCEKQLKKCEDALKTYDNYINNFKASNKNAQSRMPHWTVIICCAVALSVAGAFAFATSSILLFALAIISGVIGGYFSIKKAELIRKIKDNSKNIDFYEDRKNDLIEEKEYLELLTFNKTHKDVKIYNKFENQTNLKQSINKNEPNNENILEK